MMVVFPAPTIESFPFAFENFATDSSLDSILNAAELVDVGLAKTNASSPTVRPGVVNAPRTGVARSTVSSAVTDMVSKLSAAACVAVIVVVPVPEIVVRPVLALI